MIQGFKILDNDDVNVSLIDYFNKGAMRGEYLGFPLLHEHYTMSLGGCTDWTGSGGSGKSEFLLELLLNTSQYYGWVHLMYVPDVGDKNEVLAILIHKLTGKTFDKRYKQNLISESEIYQWLPWILEHFKIVHKTDLKAKITPYQFWDLAVEVKRQNGKLHTATIDSWKDLKHGQGHTGESFSRDDKYLDDVLSYRNAMSEEHKIHFHTIIHPLKTEKDKNGIRLPATPYDLKGGTAWYDNGKVMITVHRVDRTDNEVEIIINKSKPKSVAKNGIVKMHFDVAKARFYATIDGVKRYAEQKYFKPIGLSIDSEIGDDDEIPF